ncbi:MAG: GAF domain-containing protein [Archangium sp.]
MSFPVPADEAARLEDLKSYEVLDTQTEASFDRITRLATRLFDVPIAVVSLVDATRQWFKSVVGLEVRETSRDVAFCAHTITTDGLMVIDDALLDSRFELNPLVRGDPKIRFYAGAPLSTPKGNKLGTLCLIDRQPRELSPSQREVLADLGMLVMHELELRRERLLAERDSRRVREVLASLPSPIVVKTGDVITYANSAFVELSGRMPNALRGSRVRDLFDGDHVHHANGSLVPVKTVETAMRWDGIESVVISFLR